jgi:HEAT repeat protein
MTSEQAAAAILKRSDSQLDQLRKELEADPEAAQTLLADLSAHSDPLVRDWVTWAAPQALGSRAAAILEHLVQDTDSDVRLEAMHRLVLLDPGWARRLAPKYLKMLRGNDLVEQVNAIWRLVQLRDPRALAVLRELAETGSQQGIRNNARIASFVLEGAEDDLITGLTRHQHEVTQLWTKGLAYLGTQRALDALAAYSQEGPDPECRADARRALAARDKVKPVMVE